MINQKKAVDEGEEKLEAEGGRMEEDTTTQNTAGRREGEPGRMEIRERKRKRRITGSMAAKVTAFLLLVIFGITGMISALSCMYMARYDYYSWNLDSVLKQEWASERDDIMYRAMSYLKRGNSEAAEELCQGRNIDLALVWQYGGNHETVLWTTWDGYETKFIRDMDFSVNTQNERIIIDGEALLSSRTYTLRSYINTDYPWPDFFQKMGKLATLGYELRYSLIGVAIVSILLCMGCFIFLMCSAGHRNEREGIVPGVLTVLYLDVLTALFGIAAGVLITGIQRGCSGVYHEGIQIAVFTAGGILLGILTTVYCMDLARRAKMGNFWRHSLIYAAVRVLRRVVCLAGKGFVFLIRNLSTVMITMIVFFGICIMELIGVFVFVRETEGFLLWGLEKIALFALVAYIAVTCKKLLKASRALARGQEDYRVDTEGMFGDFKEHGENLNSLGQGISRAVAERMKSEHLKTELISNVSHDLKTPLTSIINYADLICEEAGGMREFSEWSADVREAAGGAASCKTAFSAETDGKAAESGAGDAESAEQTGQNARIREYAEVLLRQSRRLKKLLEDLMEASKATTGNLEVNLEPCEAGVLLSQAVGEYQQKMEEKQLELIARQPEQPVKIMADGRHLWRVFDNLLNNICKYAQENSRVYLSVEEKDGWIQIIFRNMSKYPLDISAEELEERFVRGDKSRHMEGNGLGLSIAKSLVELQNGKMEIVIDGDLFKVILRFENKEIL